MSSRVLTRFVARRFSDSCKILSEEKTAENIFIKKLDKLARKGPNPEKKPPTGSVDSGTVSEARATRMTSNSSFSNDKSGNYVLQAGVVASLGALGCYLQSKQLEEVRACREGGMLESHYVEEMLQPFDWLNLPVEESVPYALLNPFRPFGRLKSIEVPATLSSLPHVPNTLGTSLAFQEMQEQLIKSRSKEREEYFRLVNKKVDDLENQIDGVGLKIAANWVAVDRDYEGSFGSEVEDSATFLEDTLDNGEIQEHINPSKDKVWELRLSCCFSHKDKKLQINNLTIHGFWPGHIVDGTVKHIKNSEKEIASNKPIASTLLAQLTKDYPDIRAKMETHWISIDHTLAKEELWLHEICKHGTMDCNYWITTIEVATPFFYDDGRCKLMDVMKEEGYTEGKFSCKNFADDLSRRMEKRVFTTYRRKIEKKIYFFEIGILFDESFNMLDYPVTDFDFEEFVMEQHEPKGNDLLDSFKNTEELAMEQQEPKGDDLLDSFKNTEEFVMEQEEPKGNDLLDSFKNTEELAMEQQEPKGDDLLDSFKNTEEFVMEQEEPKGNDPLDSFKNTEELAMEQQEPKGDDLLDSFKNTEEFVMEQKGPKGNDLLDSFKDKIGKLFKIFKL